MGETAGYGFSFAGGRGGLGIFIPDSATTPFADIAARNTWAAANTADLLDGRTVVSVAGTPDTWYIWLGPDRPSTPDPADWDEYTDVVRGPVGPQGNPGTQGAPGTDGARRMFESETARDTFYDASQTNRDTLAVGSIIEVRIEAGVVALQEWLGAANPTTYGTNGPLNWRTASLRTASASIEFARNLRIFDFGQIPAFDDPNNNILALAIGQRFTTAGGSQNARQLDFPGEGTLLTASPAATPVNSPLQAVHTYPFDTTGIITNPAIVLQSVIDFVVAPNFYRVEIFRGTDDTGPLAFDERFDPGGTVGNFTARADGLDGRPSPQRFLPNTSYFFRLTGDIPFQYVQADGVTSPAGTSTGFEITFEDLATQDFVLQNLGGLEGAVELTSSVVIGAGNQATYERKFLYVPASETGNITVSIDQDLTFDGFAFFVFGTGTLIINGVGLVTVQGQSSQTYSQFQGGRVVQSPGAGNENNYGIIYENGGDGGVILQDEGVQQGGIVNTINVVGAGGSVSVAGGVATLSISGTTGPVPQPGPGQLLYGLSSETDPATVPFTSPDPLTNVANPTDPQTVSTGPVGATDRNFFIYVANTHEVDTITDTVLNQVVYNRNGPAEDNSFTLSANVRTESSVTYDALFVLNLVQGLDEDYVIDFV